jgi:hypothetical protein
VSGRLADALGRLEAEVLAAPAKAPVVWTKTAVRDADHRIEHVLVENQATGERWRKTPHRDAEHRITHVTVEQLPPSPPAA